MQCTLVVLFKGTPIYSSAVLPTHKYLQESLAPKLLWWDNSQWWEAPCHGPSLKWRGSHRFEGCKGKKNMDKGLFLQPPREAEPMSPACTMAVLQLTPDPIQNIKCTVHFWVALSVMTLHYAVNSWTSQQVDWLSWLESECWNLFLSSLGNWAVNIRNFEMKCDLLRKDLGGNNKLSIKSYSTQAHKEDVFMGGDVGGWQRLIISLYPGCWDYIFSLSFLWGYSSEEGDSQLVFLQSSPLSKSFAFLRTVLLLLFPLSLLLLQVELLISYFGSCSNGKCAQSHWTMTISQIRIQKKQWLNRVGTTLFNLGIAKLNQSNSRWLRRVLSD